ncbi:LLM class flavin-dependent oxidoreductase [Saccharopolyspora rhizosphaerae]|uniref:LLM class flavin-dependent oxidoreductase n=1 Tax=Saccharopolyspora rhizosphaerae TaxID=2492662 RepID=A0A3R8QKY2_9PSEU|nr:LLM class flavin-dependent oxidoreductase [Saccharopolyspora rhizosphaerae]RRO14763.1 LLM class flavin-dependent oxidoreductase [Saccharopolyspora rhizosphaerae]
MSPRLSVLDRSHLRVGGNAQDALRETVRFAQEVERLGYHRFWVAEHHGVPGVAGAAPTVLASAVAAATSRIRVGSGGVMLPNHQPLVVAEQFGVLASLFGDRVDVGLGRSLGFTGAIRKALAAEDASRFTEQLADLLAYLDGGIGGVHAVPAEGLDLPVFVLATRNATSAAELGLPLVIASPLGEQQVLRTIDDYRQNFRPSRRAEEPYVVLARSVAVADTTEDARRLLVPEAWAGVWSRTRGEFPPLEDPDRVLAREMTDRERTHFTRAVRGHTYGTPDDVAPALEDLLATTAADELLVTTTGHDQDERLRSYRLLAELTA